MNTLLPAAPPFFEAFLECLLANGVQVGRHVLYNVISGLVESLSAAFSGGGTVYTQLSGDIWHLTGLQRGFVRE
jgi:hypothetical protein